MSIHALKLCYDCLKGHTTRKSRSSGGRWSGRGWRSHPLGLWPLRSKLGLVPSDGCVTDGTHDREVSKLWIGDRCMANDPRDSRRENKLIMGRCILIDIYKGKYEMKGKVYSKVFNEG